MRTVVTPDEVKLGPSKTLILGAPKVGKTHFAGLWPDPCLIDVEMGSGTIPCLRIQVTPDANLLNEVLAITNEIVHSPKTETGVLYTVNGKVYPVSTIIIDTLDMIQMQEKTKILAGRRVMEFRDWGMLLEALIPLSTAIIESPIHIVVVAHSKDEPPLNGVPGDMNLDLQGALKNKVPGWFDYILHMVAGEDNSRFIVFQPTVVKLKSGLVYKFLAGDRHGTFRSLGYQTPLKMDPKTFAIDTKLVDMIMARHIINPAGGVDNKVKQSGMRKI